MWIRYRPKGSMAQVSAADVLAGRGLEELRGKAIFIGVTALSAADDRLFTPLSDAIQVPGVEIHAHARRSGLAAEGHQNETKGIHRGTVSCCRPGDITPFRP